MRKPLWLLLALGCVGDAGAPMAPQYGMGEAPVVIVQTAGDPAMVAADHGITPRFVYRHVLTGFAASVSDVARAGLMRDARVRRVVNDAAAGVSVGSWGLDRIDQRALPLDGVYAAPGGGYGVSVYIVDTGIWYTHDEYRGRAVPGFDAFNGEPYGYGVDCNGHGSHVAGTAGGVTYGVAAAVSLVGVRVLDCAGAGAWSGVFAGLDWVAANAHYPAVVNMSLGGDPYALIDDAVAGLVGRGITVVVAAGNNNANACNYSPARAPLALTIAASTATDSRASFSNYGSCVDWFAPGVDIVSAVKGSDSRTGVMSGTSMAAPHVTGAVALVLEQEPLASPARVREVLAGKLTTGIITGANGPSGLLYVGSGAYTPPPVDTVKPPVDTVAPPPPDTTSRPCPPGWRKKGRC